MASPRLGGTVHNTPLGRSTSRPSTLMLFMWCSSFVFFLSGSFQRVWIDSDNLDLVNFEVIETGEVSTDSRDQNEPPTVESEVEIEPTTTDPPKPRRHYRYYELASEIRTMLDEYPKTGPKAKRNSYSSYSRAASSSQHHGCPIEGSVRTRAVSVPLPSVWIKTIDNLSTPKTDGIWPMSPLCTTS